MEQVKLLSLTAALTVVIWITADSLVNETVSVPVTFEMLSPVGDPDVVVETGPLTGGHQLQIAAPRKLAARIQAAAPLTIRIHVPDLPTGSHQITVKELVEDQWHEFPKASVVEVQPPQVAVVVDRIVDAEVTLTLQRPTLNYEVKPQLRPTSMAVRLRQSQLRELATDGRLPPLDLTAAAEQLLKEQPPGHRVSVLVAVDPRRFGPDAVLQPHEAEVTATLATQQTTATLDTVPILLGTSFVNFKKSFEAVVRDGSELVTQSITVRGPAETVARLVRGDTRAYGIIQLKEEHFADLGVFKPMTPDFRLPEGIRLAKEPQPIELKLIRRQP